MFVQIYKKLFLFDLNLVLDFHLKIKRYLRARQIAKLVITFYAKECRYLINDQKNHYYKIMWISEIVKSKNNSFCMKIAALYS